MLDDVTLMITGGTGSFGNAVLRRFLDSNVREIRIFSRDEKKQEDMRRHYSSSKIKFLLGDVRNRDSLMDAMHGVDYVFHAAALKQVPSCEFFPLEAVNTNVLGTANVIDAASHSGVRRMICLSTDKAVYPINAMGTSKAMMEKVAIGKARSIDPDRMTICCTRYGNVMASRGSVIPLFVRQILAGEPLTITDPDMTRFMMTLDHAVDLVLFGYEQGVTGDVLVQKAPAATIMVLAKALLELFEKPDHPIRILGTRHGEKKHETLLSREEFAQAVDIGEYYRVPADMRDLNYGVYTDSGTHEISDAMDYTSENTRQLDVESMKQMLLQLPFIRATVAGEPADPEV